MEQHEFKEGDACCGGKEESCCGGGECRCAHHKALPVLVTVFGLLFLLGNLNVIGAQIVSIGWPIIVLLGGISAFMGDSCKCCK